jgi:hypothetical protein
MASEKQVIETVQGASGVDLSLLSPEEREALAALLTKAQAQTAPPWSASSSQVAEPAEVKGEGQV